MGDARLTMEKNQETEDGSYYVPDFTKFKDPRAGLQLVTKAAKEYLPIYDNELQAERNWKTFTSYGKRENYYRVIEVDAFSSDAIPVHLITKEAIDMYMSKLMVGREIEEPDPKDSTKTIKRWISGGVLCVHTSNRHVNLVQPVLGICKVSKLAYVVAKDEGGEEGGRDVDWSKPSENGHFGSEYVLVARDQRDLPPYTLTDSQMENYKAVGAYATTYSYQQVELYKSKGVKTFKGDNPRLHSSYNPNGFFKVSYSSSVDFYGPDAAKDPKVNIEFQYGGSRRTVLEHFQYTLPEGARTWTDDYSNVLSVFRW